MNTARDFTASSINPVLKIIIAPKFRWLRHLLFISVGLVLAFKGDIALPANYGMSRKAADALLIMDGALFIIILSTLYFLILFLIPRLLFRSKYILFFLSCFILMLLVYISLYILEGLLIKPVLPKPTLYQYADLTVTDIVQKGLIIGVMMGCVVGLQVFRKWIIDVQRMNALQQESLKTELEQLKSQVNPHFLFNTLNNLLVLTKTDPEKATQVLLGLSDLLRYQLYDSTREKILLSKDIEFIHNLLALEKIRKDDFAYDIHTEGKTGGILLPPFLFIPFVENAIKHGASAVGHSYLKLHFRITYKMLSFESENSKPLIKSSLPGGLGLKNIKRRLELLYPGNYTLEIKDMPDKYIVHLTLPL